MNHEGSAAVRPRLGIDFNTYPPAPRPSTIKGAGFTFVCQYLAGPGLLTQRSARDFIAAGIDVVAHWEKAQHAARHGFTQGVQDARNARMATSACGMPEGRPVYFSVDWDAAVDDLTAIEAYTDGIASVLGLDRTGVYADYDVLEWLFNAGKITWGWQAYAPARSAGRNAHAHPRAQLRQTGGTTLDGTAVDVDQAMADDFGQWTAKDRPGHRSPASLEKAAMAVSMLRVI